MDINDAKKELHEIADRGKDSYPPAIGDIWIYTVILAKALIAVIDYLLKRDSA